MEDLANPVFEGLAIVVAAPTDACQRDHMVIRRDDVVDLKLRQRDLYALGEEAQNALASTVVARRHVMTGDMPNDVLVQVLVQPFHVTSDERRVSPSNQLCVCLCRHDSSS